MLAERSLVEKYQLTISERYRLTQIHYYVQTLAHKGDLATMTPMEHLCRQYDKLRGHISAIYTILMYVINKTELHGPMGTRFPRNPRS